MIEPAIKIIEEFINDWSMGYADPHCLNAVLEKMARQGSSVLLNWGEDNRLWECSWITSGKRFTSFSITPGGAVVDCIRQVLLAEAIE